MGTNYYRIPSEGELDSRRIRLLSRIGQLDISGTNVARGFRDIEGGDEWELLSPWDEFEMGMRVHLGKRSGGWRFTWNFHKGRYYGNRQELFAFIRSGRVVDEYGEELSPDEFIEMALNWYPDGEIFCLDWVRRKQPANVILYRHEQYDREEDGLVISASTDFS